MSKIVGRLVDLGIGRETSRGVGVAPDFWVPKVRWDFDDSIVEARDIGSFGAIDDADDAFPTTNFGTGEMEAEIRSKSIGLLLYALLGTWDGATGPVETTVYTHTFTILQSNTHPSLSLLVVDANETRLHKLVMINTFTINVALDEVVKFVCDFLGKRSVGSSGAASYTAEKKFTKKHLSFKVAADRGSLGAATAVSLKNLSITFNKNAIMDDRLGTAEPEDILNQALSVEGEIELPYEDVTWKNYVLNGDHKAMEIILENTDELIGTTLFPKITITLPKVGFYAYAPSRPLDEIVSQTISFKAYRDVANDEDLVYSIVLQNEQDTY